MMLIILDNNPVDSANKIPNKLKFKQLLELAQMISTITGSVYKPVRQGKEIMEWIKKNPYYIASYYTTLFNWCIKNTKLKQETTKDLTEIFNSFSANEKYNTKPKTAIFRYSKAYKDTKYATNSELPIDVAIEEYTKYLKWKGHELVTQNESTIKIELLWGLGCQPISEQLKTLGYDLSIIDMDYCDRLKQSCNTLQIIVPDSVSKINYTKANQIVGKLIQKYIERRKDKK